VTLEVDLEEFSSAWKRPSHARRLAVNHVPQASFKSIWYFTSWDSPTALRLSGNLRDLPLVRNTLMIDEMVTALRRKIGQRIGCTDAATMRAVDMALALFLGGTDATRRQPAKWETA
jgi:hypothetical protein